MPVRVAPSLFCPRRLAPAGPNVKRYMSAPKPLIAYMIACPSCGFCEMHMEEAMRFVEEARDGAPALIGAANVARCGCCRRALSIADGFIHAATVG